MNRFWRYLLGLSLAVCFFSQEALAQLDFSQWLIPGPLSRSHESLKGATQCDNCHATAKGVPDRKCLDCHKELQERVARKRGYHGRVNGDCRACHPEHKGADFDLFGLSRIPFTHEETGWPLEGKHADTKCEDCHTQARVNASTGEPTNRRTYLATEKKCVTCHEDIHRSKKKSFQACEKCHTAATWKKTKPKLNFDHGRETDYRLTGDHRQVKCYDCHKTKTWAPLPFDKCSNCHADPHKGKFGPICRECHSTKSWKASAPEVKSGFDHSQTKFPLTGEHREVSCKTCHGPKIGPVAKFKECDDCHNDPHGKQFKQLWKPKEKCTECHLTDGWRILSFQHGRDSRYKLEGKHQAIPCEQCHVKRVYRWMKTSPDCDSCHRDVHRAQFNKTCASCHKYSGFNDLNFDHGRDSPFPLVGKHKIVECESCHVNGRYKPLQRNCVGCHNDFHKGQLGMECRRCHAPTAFNDVEFDHNRGSRFRLEGQHTITDCNQCHKNYEFKVGMKKCADCHKDLHGGQFGDDCQRCHTVASFQQSGGFHNFGEFSLGGKHSYLECDVCHGERVAARPLPTTCETCHVDPHMKSFGTRCDTCHTQNYWLPSTFRHNQTGFELSGAHRFTTCDSCHSNRVFGGLPQECIFCHQKDFVPTQTWHIGAPTTCDTCHFTLGFRPVRGVRP